MRKEALSGFVLLVPQRRSFARLFAASILSTCFLVLLLIARPHRDRSTALVAVVANVGMVLTLLVAILIEVYAVVPEGSTASVLGLESKEPLMQFVAGISVVVLVLGGGIAAYRVWQEARAARRAARWELATLRPPTCTWRGQRKYAAFLRARRVAKSPFPVGPGALRTRGRDQPQSLMRSRDQRC